MYRYLIIAVLFFSVNLSCTTQKTISNKWDNSFVKNDITGTFVLYDTKTKQYKFHDKSRANKRYLPASTFKILNSLIALETKVIRDENEIIKWDSIDKGWIKWNQDHTLKSAISVSCVWCYQDLARRIGKKQMQKYINEVGYGNKLMGAKEDNFWLVGDLKISAIEQVKFLEKLINNKLPFKVKNQEIVKEIMITDSNEKYVMHSKTGWGTMLNPQIGWLVGYVERDENTWIFALNIDIIKKSDKKYRKKLVYEILKMEGVID